MTDGCPKAQSRTARAGQIFSYVKSTGVYVCPDDPEDDDPGAASNADSYTPDYPISYAYNRNIAGDAFKTLRHPEKTVVLFEAEGGYAHLEEIDERRKSGAKSFSPIGDGTDGNLVASFPCIETLHYVTGIIGKRIIAPPRITQFPDPTGIHDRSANYLFADGHVKLLLPGQVSSGSNTVSLKVAQTGTLIGHAAGTLNPTYIATFSVK